MRSSSCTKNGGSRWFGPAVPGWRTLLAALALLVGGVTSAPTAGATASPSAEASSQGPPPSYALATQLEEFVTSQSVLLRPVWAGSRLIANNRVEVALTTDRVPESLRRPEIVFVQRRHATEVLDRAMEVVTARLNPLLAPGVGPGTRANWPYFAQLNYDANTIDVQLLDEARRAEVERVLRDEISDGRVRVVGGKAPAQVDDHCLDRQHCDDPFRGGTRIDSSSGSACTMAFVMRSNVTGARTQSTASHCAGSPWSHSGVAIGPTAFTQDSGDVDFKVIQQNNETQPAPTNWVLRNSGTVAITLKQGAPGSMGTTICHTGFRTGDACAPITSTNLTFDGRPGFGGYGPIDTCSGNSGAAVLNNGNNRAYGVYKGRLGPTADCVTGVTGVFTWINKAEAASNHSVLLAATSETLAPGQRMPPGYALVAPNSTYNLQMQGDGNLVIYLNGVAQWSTGTNGNFGAYGVMQNDGNLVIYSAGGSTLWARPGASRVPGSRLVMQSDGNLVIYTPSGSAPWHRLCGC